MAANHTDTQEVNRLYARYVTPLERDHMGEYAAVTADGRMVTGSTLLETVEQAISTLGPDNVVFKGGERAVGKLLCLTTR
jgi:hypothetical protein